MKKYSIYLMSLFMMGSLLTSCEENNPSFYDGNSNGAYFDYQNPNQCKAEVNFANHILANPSKLPIKIKIKLMGYIKDIDRKLVLKAEPMDEYPMAGIEIPEIIFKAGEYAKEVEVNVARPEEMDIRYGAVLRVDEQKSDIGEGAQGFMDYVITAEESYAKPQRWDNGAKNYFGDFTAEKHIFIVNVTKDEKYFNKNPWGVQDRYQKQVIDSIRTHNQKYPDNKIKFGISFTSGVDYAKPYYWGEKQDLYLGQFNSNNFINMCNQAGVTTLNEVEFFTGSDEQLKNLNKAAVVNMMNSFNMKLMWWMPLNEFRNEQITMFPDVDYDVVAPQWWFVCPQFITPYYGDYSPAKYKFMIKTLLKEKGKDFFLLEMFPVFMSGEVGDFAWDNSVGGQAGIEACYQLFYTEWEKNKDQYDFTFPKR